MGVHHLSKGERHPDPSTVSQYADERDPDFRVEVLDAWANEHHVRLHFIPPGKPVENTFVEFQGQVSRVVTRPLDARSPIARPHFP